MISRSSFISISNVKFILRGKKVKRVFGLGVQVTKLIVIIRWKKWTLE